MSLWHRVIWLADSKGGAEAPFGNPKGRLETPRAPLNCSWSTALPTPSVPKPPEPAPEVSYLAAIALALLLLLFTYLTCRCWARRRPPLDNPLDVPLPPFQGPGEGPATTEALPFSEADFLPGGDIYESFVANLTKIKGRRAQQEPVTVVQPAQGHDALSKYFKGVRPTLSEELAALASIKITRDRCHGLRKAKSEERPMTRLLFVDGHDQSGGSDDDPL